jgi:hypothetical protein
MACGVKINRDVMDQVALNHGHKFKHKHFFTVILFSGAHSVLRFVIITRCICSQPLSSTSLNDGVQQSKGRFDRKQKPGQLQCFSFDHIAIKHC